MKNYSPSLMAHCYFIATVACVLMALVLDMTEAITALEVFGFHTAFYGVAAVLLPSSRWLVIACLIFWAAACIGLLVSYSLFVIRGRYLPLAVTALLDTVFSLFVVIRAIISVGFYEAHIPMLFGIVTSLFITVHLFRKAKGES